ncbi:MAG TPA: hypothetical protein QGI39_06625, partial [Gammaproteobacteria bacterium]|nr:hypothetical protein [Gammaproteobacteria bacterium]
SSGWVDATSLFSSGTNTLSFYHYTGGDGSGVKVRIHTAETEQPLATELQIFTDANLYGNTDPIEVSISYRSNQTTDIYGILQAEDGTIITATSLFPLTLVHDYDVVPLVAGLEPLEFEGSIGTINGSTLSPGTYTLLFTVASAGSEIDIDNIINDSLAYSETNITVTNVSPTGTLSFGESPSPQLAGDSLMLVGIANNTGAQDYTFTAGCTVIASNGRADDLPGQEVFIAAGESEEFFCTYVIPGDAEVGTYQAVLGLYSDLFVTNLDRIRANFEVQGAVLEQPGDQNIPEPGSSYFSLDTNLLQIPALDVPELGLFGASLRLIADTNPPRFTLEGSDLLDNFTGKRAVYLLEQGQIYIPDIDVPGLGRFVIVLQTVEGGGEFEFELASISDITETNTYLSELAFSLVEESLVDNLQGHYQNGQKWLAFFSGGGFKALEATIYIDLADYMGITPEGGAGQNDDQDDSWVTVWVDGTVGASIGAPVALGVTRLDFSGDEPDVRPWYNISIISGTAPGFSLSLLEHNTAGTQTGWDNFSYGSISLSASLVSISANLLHFEIRKSVLDGIIESAFHSLQGSLEPSDLGSAITTVLSNFISYDEETWEVSVRVSGFRWFTSSD